MSRKIRLILGRRARAGIDRRRPGCANHERADEKARARTQDRRRTDPCLEAEAMGGAFDVSTRFSAIMKTRILYRSRYVQYTYTASILTATAPNPSCGCTRMSWQSWHDMPGTAQIKWYECLVPAPNRALFLVLRMERSLLGGSAAGRERHCDVFRWVCAFGEAHPATSIL